MVAFAFEERDVLRRIWQSKCRPLTQSSFYSMASAALVACFLATCLATPGYAQSIEGEWSNTPSSCGHYTVNNDNIRVRSDGYGIFESFCEFTGGSKDAPDHWQMKITCTGEGGGQDPEKPVDLQVFGGKLRVLVDGATYYYAKKCAAETAPSPRTYWDHNGSVMYLVAEGDRRQFFYSQPRGAMQEAGVHPDTLLFDGTTAGKRYDGTAFLFDQRCGGVPYHVSGPILDDYKRVELSGRAPRVNENCLVLDYFPDVLVFTLEPGQ